MLAGLGSIWWIAIGAQLYGSRSQPLPRNIDGCVANVTTNVNDAINITSATTYTSTQTANR